MQFALTCTAVPDTAKLLKQNKNFVSASQMRTKLSGLQLSERRAAGRPAVPAVEGGPPPRAPAGPGAPKAEEAASGKSRPPAVGGQVAGRLGGPAVGRLDAERPGATAVCPGYVISFAFLGRISSVHPSEGEQDEDEQWILNSILSIPPER